VPLVSAAEVDRLSHSPMGEGSSITVAVAAYIEECELRTFGEEHKEMCKIRLDVDGGRYEFVQWPKKDSKKVADVYRQPLKGSVVIAVLNKWSDNKPFQLQDIRMIQPPLNVKKGEDQ
jgi:hypothetical protein